MATRLSPSDLNLAQRIRALIGEPTYAYDTHRSLLAEAVIRTSGAILELGMGYGSSPGLHRVGALTGRRVVSYEDDPKWFAEMGDGGGLGPEVHLISDWDQADLSGQWSVALVDHGVVNRRVREIGRLVGNCEVVVVHDTEDAVYRYWTVWGLFRHRLDDMRRKPWTSAFSNSLELEKWEL